MKRILFASVIFWLLCSSSLLAQTQGLDYYLYSSKYVQSIENNLQYRYYPFAHTSLDISGLSSLENRLNFNQESKNSQFKLGFNIEQKAFSHRFDTDYLSLYDASDLEPSPYVNKTASLGYQLAVEPLDSLSINVFGKALMRKEQDRYISGNQLSSEGYWLGSNGHYAAEHGLFQGGLSIGAERKKLAWEAFDAAQSSVYINLYSTNLIIDANANINQRNDDIYELKRDSLSITSYYSLSDNQKRRKSAVVGTVQYIPDERFLISLTQTLNHENVAYRNNEKRNNEETYNASSLGLNYEPHPLVTLHSSFDESSSKRAYRNAVNNRIVEMRRWENRLIWEYSASDSLILSANLDLQMSSYPNDNHNYDNDLLTKSFRLGWKHYWHQRIRVGMWLGYALRDDIYTNAILSANNKQVTSYSLQPDCQFILGDRIAFVQTYQLKADYNDYTYGAQTGKANTFYRQVAYKYNLIFDTFPFIARSQDPIWLKLPFRSSPDNALLVDMSYAYEENQYADEVGDHYNLHAKNRRHTASFSIRHDIKSFFWTLTPKYSWGTWQEYSALLGFAWQFNNNSLVELSISPYGNTTDNLDWRSTLNLNLRF
ncbi:MAG: hypothetical protein PHH43_06090 [Candidatus Cloacimonetes bacterium]|nr:hypothetical protein [Candidatus Cloacimonadota bacterium]